jgi:hypothetical protein
MGAPWHVWAVTVPLAVVLVAVVYGDKIAETAREFVHELYGATGGDTDQASRK